MWIEISLILLAFALAWFWFDSIGARERAIEYGHQLSSKVSLQLLDETVACSRISFARNSRGHMQIQRRYDFDVSVSGGDRLHCELVLLGNQLQSWTIPPYPLH
jgi:hypothetical protein